MIADRIENIENYYEEHPEFKLINDFITAAAGKFEDGSYELDGQKLVANVQSYKTDFGRELKFEAHRKYADFQYIIKGFEKIAWAPLESVENNLLSEDFSKGGDCAFYQGESKFDFVLTKGAFLYLLPQDAHAPCLPADKEVFVQKIVFKIKL